MDLILAIKHSREQSTIQNTPEWVKGPERTNKEKLNITVDTISGIKRLQGQPMKHRPYNGSGAIVSKSITPSPNLHIANTSSPNSNTTIPPSTISSNGAALDTHGATFTSPLMPEYPNTCTIGCTSDTRKDFLMRIVHVLAAALQKNTNYTCFNATIPI